MPATYTPVHIRHKKKIAHLSSQEPVERRPVLLHTQRKKRLAAVMESREVNPKPSLLSLPSEILETILLYSKNVALPQADHVLGMKLSARATLVRLVVVAFHETWDSWFGIPVSKSILHGPWQPDTKTLPSEGDYTLQVGTSYP